MRILALFKMVPKLEDLTDSDWEVGPSLRPDDSYAREVANPDDESALEISLRIRDSLGARRCFLAAMTMGDSPAARRFGKTLKALGFDRVSLNPVDFEARFCPDLMAGAIAANISDSFQLVRTGARSADGQNGLTAMYLAEFLKWPLITEVTNAYVDPGHPGELSAESLSDGLALLQAVRPPLILSIGNAPSAFL
ncbi:MAG: hypothetical protein LBU69_03900, partial [Deltaproteobacteria bacterium]|nr:hypothetical protein [Deltaproteobacteria bacterium]